MTAVASSSASIPDSPVVVVEKPKRRRTPILIGVLASAAVIGGLGYEFLTAGRETTDDAQVEGRTMSVSARVQGQVLRVAVTDNQTVEAGDVLVELDPADYQAKANIAKADLAAAQAAVDASRSALAIVDKTAPAALVQAQGALATASATVTSAHASIEQARADVAAAASRRALAELNLKRARALGNEAAIAVADVDTRQTEYENADAQWTEAKARLDVAQAALTGTGGGITLAKGRLDAAATADEQRASAKAALALAEAKVEQTKANLDAAELNLGYTKIKATRKGVISHRTVEQGQIVGPDRPLLVVVPLDDVWVVANFKEDQLADMHAGEKASIRLDTYGRREFPAHVESIAGGTGAHFALLPPDNATGNFVKVVQRVPVLLRLDGNPGVELRPGMSADVTVSVKP